MPGVSSTTSVLPLRIPNELMERLGTLVGQLGATRNDVGRDALVRGIEQLEEQVARRKEARAGRRKRPAGAAVQLPAKPTPKGRRKRQDAEPAAAAVAEPPPSLAAGPADAALRDFAEQVLESARRSKTGRFGEDRLFISHAWRQYKRDRKPKGMDLEAFKQRLLEANRERVLDLVCADMAPFLDQKDVQESEIRYLSATFHLVCT